MVFFSHSGNTEEVNYAAELVQKHQVPLLSIVGSKGELLKYLGSLEVEWGEGLNDLFLDRGLSLRQPLTSNCLYRT